MRQRLMCRSSGIVGFFILLVLPLIFSQCSRSPQPRIWVQDWEAVSPLAVGRTGAKAVSFRDRIYVMGGGFGTPGPDTILDSVEFVKIRKDGTLGKWEKGPSMKTPRMFLAAAEANDNVIYALGGEFFPGGKMRLLNSVESSLVAPNGELGPWRKLNSMLTPRRSPTVTVAGVIFMR